MLFNFFGKNFVTHHLPFNLVFVILKFFCSRTFESFRFDVSKPSLILRKTRNFEKMNSDRKFQSEFFRIMHFAAHQKVANIFARLLRRDCAKLKAVLVTHHCR